MKLTAFLGCLKLPAVLVAAMSVSCITIAAGQSPISPLPASVNVNAITVSVTPNPAKVKEKVTMTASVSTNNKAATGGTVTFF